MNFPGDWFELSTHKEIKRINKKLDETLSFKLQFVSSLFLAILPLFLSGVFPEWTLKQNLIVLVICIILSLVILILPSLKSFVQFHYRNNEGEMRTIDQIEKDFDEVVILNVMAAVEFYNALSNIPPSDLQEDLKFFYKEEIKYHVNTAKKTLSKDESGFYNAGLDKKSAEKKCNNPRVDSLRARKLEIDKLIGKLTKV